jgi:hypothetical protein
MDQIDEKLVIKTMDSCQCESIAVAVIVEDTVPKSESYNYEWKCVSTKLLGDSLPDSQIEVKWDTVKKFGFAFMLQFNDNCSEILQVNDESVVHFPYQIFELHKHEYIHQIDFHYKRCNYYSTNYFPVVGVRFHTNKRISQLFGSNGTTTESVKVSEGYAICNIITSKYNRKIVQCTIYSCPVSKYCRYNSHKFCQHLKSVPDRNLNELDHSSESVILANQLKALVIQVGTSTVKKISALSLREYNHAKHFAADLPVSVFVAHEQMLALDDDEFIKGIEYGNIQNEEIEGIRFYTNHRTTHWYGRVGTSTSKVDIPDGNAIWGFYFYKGDGKEYLGCIYHPMQL